MHILTREYAQIKAPFFTLSLDCELTYPFDENATTLTYSYCLNERLLFLAQKACSLVSACTSSSGAFYGTEPLTYYPQTHRLDQVNRLARYLLKREIVNSLVPYDKKGEARKP
uniref:Orf112b n=1 Tax=Batis maritima TaxID=4436 RepID=A0A068BD64_BATMA|nr:orf112b [Batis maritima]AIC83382.1 orf112b [Batis maritima]